MTVQVNPPAQIKLPKELQQSQAVSAYFRSLEKVIFQLWNRTGAGTDFVSNNADNTNANDNQIAQLHSELQSLKGDVSELAETTNPIIDTALINERIDDLEGESGIVNLSDVLARLNDLESDVAQVAIQAEAAGVGGVSKVTQYTGTIASSSSTVNVTIPAVNLSTTFVILTTRVASGNNADDIAATATLSTTTNVAISRGGISGILSYVLQVIEN